MVVTVVIGSVGSVAIGVGVPNGIVTADGAGDGSCVGVGLGIDVWGAADGARGGNCVGVGLGIDVCGAADGAEDGSCVGVGLGIDVWGAADGAGDGSCVGVGLGAAVSGSWHAVPWTIDSTRCALRSDDDLATYASPSVVAIAII